MEPSSQAIPEMNKELTDPIPGRSSFCPLANRLCFPFILGHIHELIDLNPLAGAEVANSRYLPRVGKESSSILGHLYNFFFIYFGLSISLRHAELVTFSQREGRHEEGMAVVPPYTHVAW